jgi:hypothetical protein
MIPPEALITKNQNASLRAHFPKLVSCHVKVGDEVTILELPLSID